jgi:putative inorganic carbon (HCO3(-)) transporter
VRPSFSGLLSQIVPGPTGTFNSRIGIWARAISYIQDCPFTGYGLGSFRAVDTLFHGPGLTGAPGIITSSTASVFDVGVPHAHNFALQTAYDLGVPGLVAYLALLFLALWMCWRIYRHGQGVPRALGIGCQSALIAYHVYGLTDVVAMGAKPGVLWWALLALIAALHRLVPLRERLDNKEPSLGRGSAEQP